MRASLASLLVTSLVLTTTAQAQRGKKRRPAPKKKPPANAPAPAPDAVPAPDTPPAPGADNAPAAGSPEATAKAKELIKEGTKLYNVQQYAQAAELYQQAYLLDPVPAYLYASAQSQRLHGDCEKALLSYRAYLRTNPAEGERAKAEANIERCEQDLREKEAIVREELVKAPYYVPPPPPPPPAEVVVAPPPPPPEKSYIVGHVLLGLGLGAIGGGVYLLRDGRNAVEAHNGAPTYDEYIAGRADIDGEKQKQLIGVAAIAGGGALVSGAILFYVLRSRGGDEQPPPVSATVSPGQTTITFTRTF